MPDISSFRATNHPFLHPLLFFSMSSSLYTHLIPNFSYFRSNNPTASRSSACSFRCLSSRRSSPPEEDSQSNNKLLKLAWHGSELLGIVASLFRSPAPPDSIDLDRRLEIGGEDACGLIERARIVETIKDDFQRSYFVTGNLTPDVYEENCEFADPAGSFKGLHRFKRNCSNFGLLLKKSEMKLMKWEDFEDRGVGHWRFTCVMVFPWRPILSATGYTEYYFDNQSGRICRHVEHWNVPKMALLKQIFTPSRNA